MYQTINRCDFHDAFRQMNVNDFSRPARNALFDYLESIEECGQPIELDVISLCCDYTEDKIENVLISYNLESLDDLRNETFVVWDDGKNVLYAVY